MFTPTSFKGRLFNKYLSVFSHPAKIRIQNILGERFLGREIFLKNEEGVLFALDPNDWITRIMLLEGDYEPGTTNLAKNILKAGGLFLDVGANFGLFSCIVANKNERIKVIAVEPNHRMINRLINNIRFNGLEARVQVINAAVSKKFQLLSLEQPVSNNMGTVVTSETGKGILSILSCSLEYIYRQNGNIPVDLLKLDIEGNEFEVLEDFPFETLQIKNIILEFNHLSKTSFSSLYHFFSGKGFSLFTIHGETLDEGENLIPENNIWIVNNKNK